MSRDLDTRARQAAANLKAAISEAELTPVPPGTPRRRRVLVAVLRPAWIVALLLIGSAVAVAMVLDSSPPTETIPPTPNTTIVTPTTVARMSPSTVAPESAPTTAAAVVPVDPTTTTVAPDTEPPLLEITSPEEGAEFEEKTITFAGVTESGARVFAGKYEADVDTEGNWHIVLKLGDGKTVARFVARDAAGNESEASVTVYYLTPTTTTTKPEPTTTEKELAAFTANQKYETCSDTPPFNVYYGTGEPGSWVNITSDYGSAELVVGENGEWLTDNVYFQEAPPGNLGVRIADQYGRVVEFEFVYTP